MTPRKLVATSCLSLALLLSGCGADSTGTYAVGSAATAAGAAALAAVLAAKEKGGSGEAGGGSSGSAGSKEICHIPPGNADAAHTIRVNSHAEAAHLAHGDTVGACQSDE